MTLEKILLEHEQALIDELVERYRISFSELRLEVCTELENIMKKMFSATIQQDHATLKEACKEIAHLNYHNHIPYLVFLNELNTFKNRLTSILINQNAKDEVFELHKIYSDVENILAFEHLHNYLKQLMCTNNTRINGIKDLIKKHLVQFYQSHLEWLNQLALAIESSQSSMIPELNHSLCTFGRWLEQNGKLIISNNSKYKHIFSIHATLHALAHGIKTQMEKEQVNYNILVSYLEKCEFISLSIGTELALIDNRLLVHEASKDEMTGALNRNSLENLFVNQYDLSLATDNSMVLAMCDLDHFKQINDTYGHLTGDKILKNFVTIVKNRLRDSDIVIRYGGEEFIIIMPNSNLTNGESKLDTIREAFADFCYEYEGLPITTTVSIGAVAIKPSTPYSHLEFGMEHWLKEVDELLYIAKSEGRNRVIVKAEE